MAGSLLARSGGAVPLPAFAVYTGRMHTRNPTHPVERLLAGQQPALATWYGEPLGAVTAAALYTRAQRELQPCLNRGAFPLHVLQLVCDFWRRADGAPAYETLAAAAASRREQALLELVYGQLLMSRKLRPANAHLARGFGLAAPWLASVSYFELVRRHERLACLRLTDTAAPAQGLSRLLSEAAVVRRLRDGGKRRGVNEHCDTVG